MSGTPSRAPTDAPARLTREAVAWVAHLEAAVERHVRLQALFRQTGPFDASAADLVTDLVRDLCESDSAQNTFWDQHLASGTRPLERWVAARRHEEAGRLEQALEAWLEVERTPDGRLPEAALASARLLARLNRGAQGWEAWHRAVRECDDPHLFARAVKVAQKLRVLHPPSVQKKLRVALLSSTTTGLYKPILEGVALRDRLDLEIWEAPYGTFRQQILQADSELYAFRPEVVLLMVNHGDAGLAAWTADPDAEIERVTGEFAGLWRTLLERHPCRVLHNGFDLPAGESYGGLASVCAEGRLHLLREINRRLASLAPAAVVLVDAEYLSGRPGRAQWHDPSQWFMARQYPGVQALPELARVHVALMRAAVGLTRKVLVLDLDNTLWGGVIGEDGIGGIRVGPPSAAGEAHQAFQRYVLELKQRGILLAVVSKNNDTDARQPFEQHDGMVLKLDDFVIFRANWRDKPSNLREIATVLNLGIDSFVFVDDNPVERDLMRRELPEVAVPEIGGDPVRYVEKLERERCFEALTLSAEDRERHRSYQANVRRDELKASSGSLEEFLRNLQMTVTSGPVSERTLERVVQLLNKTNQFNVTTRRHSSADVARMMTSEHHWTRYFKLTDRYGDNGLVGVLLARRDDVNADTWEIDSFLLSCRVIGRRLEEYMMRALLTDLEKRGAKKVVGVYRPTPKNGMVADLFVRLGFQELSPAPAGEGERRYVLVSPFSHADLTFMTEVFEGDLPSTPRERHDV